MSRCYPKLFIGAIFLFGTLIMQVDWQARSRGARKGLQVSRTLFRLADLEAKVNKNLKHRAKN
ncbi:hypothetical protein NA56DRAFT_706010 [Hyaloscypha hepaticicola]|uniref:Uncharacterized protein n=1 Tax=Hyaloscypha hepaticicola TaxID=2082293 RepID=A0A2J6PY65_9HELO|nr:hypothetical protein NA56DRAFT_706010 [Hyaloscypha hepaticicola]